MHTYFNDLRSSRLRGQRIILLVTTLDPVLPMLNNSLYG